MQKNQSISSASLGLRVGRHRSIVRCCLSLRVVLALTLPLRSFVGTAYRRDLREATTHRLPVSLPHFMPLIAI